MIPERGAAGEFLEVKWLESIWSLGNLCGLLNIASTADLVPTARPLSPVITFMAEKDRCA
jgi:hypothetical protein